MPQSDQASPTAQIIYKYTDQHGAEQILSNRTLRFARSSEMNDPFDVRIDEWIGMDHKRFFEESGPLLIERLMARPEFLSVQFGIDLDRAKATAERFHSMPEREKAALVEEIKNIPAEEFARDFARAVANVDKVRDLVANVLGSYAIFCATGTFDNLLMWAHYAQGHRGVVLGFRPDIERDSMLRLLKPVVYRDDRPHGIESPEAWVRSLDLPGVEIAREISERLLHTKGAAWSYEQEWRLSIPDGTEDGESAGFFGFLPNELEEVYLGYRMTGKMKDEFARLAKSLNPHVRIFAAGLARRKYALEFERLP